MSYPPESNVPLTAAPRGWVGTLVSNLQGQPSLRLEGNAVDIVCDAPPEGVRETVQSAAAWLVVLSRAYAGSRPCQRELAAILEAAGEERTSRVFVVELDGVERPAELAGLPGYRITPADAADRRKKVILDLAYKLADVLKARRAALEAPPTGVGPASIGVLAVYLAEATDDLHDDEYPQDLRRCLEQAGHAVLPIGPLPRDHAACLQAIETDLRRSRIFVQLLGKYAGQPLTGSDRSLVAAQHEAALAAKFPILQWRPPELSSPESIERVRDPNHRQRLLGTVACDFAEFKQQVLVALDPRSARKLRRSKPHDVATRCPYPGLRPFTSDEADVFHGRDEQVHQLVERLEARRLLAVVGTSGSGKSSLARAGLIPRLLSGELGEPGARWVVATMRPGDQPMRRLASALLDPSLLGPAWGGLDEPEAFLEAGLRRGPLGLVELIRQSSLPPGCRLLLLVDQFEEIFRYRRDDPALVDAQGAELQRRREEAIDFVALLLKTIETDNAPIFIVLTMRSDYLGDCALFQGLPEALNDSQFLAPRLERAQLAEAIRGPAELFDGRVEPALVNRLLNDMGSHPDQLPLMQHALMRLWKGATPEKDGRELTLAAYASMGGLPGALEGQAEAAFLSLNPPQQRIAEILFRQVSERTGATRDARRPTPLAEVAEVARATPDGVRAVIDVFRDPDLCFLTPAFPSKIRDDEPVDISHESLIRHWQRLRSWVEAEASDADLYRRLAGDAERFSRTPPEASLWIPPQLDLALAWKERIDPTPTWAARHGGQLDRTLSFLKQSQQARDEAVRMELQRTFELEMALEAAQTQKRFADSLRLAAQSQTAYESTPITSLLLAVEAARATAPCQPPSGAFQVLYDRLATIGGRAFHHGTAVTKALIAPDGRLVTAGDYGVLRVWDLNSNDAPPRELKGHLGRIVILALASDGRLVSGGFDGVLRVWDLNSNDAPPRELQGHEGWIRTLALASDGRLVTAGEDGVLRVWDLNSNDAPPRELRGHQGGIRALALASDGRLASGGGDGELRVWDLNSPDTPPRELRGHRGWISTLALASDGRLASGGEDGVLRVWDLNSPDAPPRELRGHEGEIRTLALASDGRLASGGEDGVLRVWDLNSPDAPPRELRGHEGEIRTLALASEGRLASGDSDGMLRVWDLNSTNGTPRELRGHRGGIRALALASEGRLVSGGSDGVLRVWDLNSPNAPPRELQGHEGWIRTLALASDGRLASGGDDGELRVWDLKSNDAPPRELRGHEGWIWTLALASDGRLASGGEDGVLRVWDLNSPNAPPRELRGHRG